MGWKRNGLLKAPLPGGGGRVNGSFVNPLHGLNLSSLLPTLQLFLIRLKIIVSEIRPPLQTGKRRRNAFKISTRWE